MSKTAREIAADILCEIDKGAMSHAALNSAFRKYDLIPSDKDMTKLLVSGVLEHLTEIDGIIDSYSKKTAAGLKPIVRNVLRISIYQLSYMQNVPQSAVCNEAVKIIDRRKLYGLKGFVNAVLRNYADKAPKSPRNASSELPRYIYDILLKRCGNEQIKAVIKAFDAPSKLTCRFNLSKASEAEIIDSLKAQGIEAVKSYFVNNGYEIIGDVPVGEIEAFKAGLIQIQGLSSIYAAEALAPNPGAKVLDICAAPGGKSIAIADMVGADGKVVSRDLTDKKVRMIMKNAVRCGFSQIEAEVKDAASFYPEDECAYDFVLADLPCSGLGTLGHKQEVRYRVSAEKVSEIARLQRSILSNAARYVKPGGRLVYSTCTFTYEENEVNAAFIRDSLGLSLISERQLLPGIDPVSDGFYVAVFVKE